MKIITFIILVLLAIVLNVCAQEFPAVNPEAPIPVAIEKKIENVKNIILAVITALTVVGTAAVGLWVYIMGQIRQAKATQDLQVKELKDRQDRLSRKNSELQAQVTQTALVTPAAAPPAASPATPVLIALLCGSMALMGCQSIPERPPLNVTGMSKQQIELEDSRLDLEHAKLVENREIRNAGWVKMGQAAGNIFLQLGASWVRAKLLPNSQGLRK